MLAVLAIHMRGVLRGSGGDGSLVMREMMLMMFVLRDFANAVNAAIHSIGKQGSGRERGIEKCYGEEAKQSGRGSNWLVARHEDTYSTRP